MSIYADKQLVATVLPGLSVRKTGCRGYGWTYLVDDINDTCIAQTSKEIVDPHAWAIGRLARRIGAIADEVSKYEARLQLLGTEAGRLQAWLTKLSKKSESLDSNPDSDTEPA